jgi:CRP/FNR family cyclic AMP-dependent transcriptional regulator
VRKPAKNEFDPKAFLARLGAGKTILSIKKNQHVFEQGDVADTVFSFKRAGSSSLSYPSRARKR